MNERQKRDDHEKKKTMSLVPELMHVRDSPQYFLFN